MQKYYGKIKYIDRSKNWSIYEAEPHVMIRLKDLFKGIKLNQTLPIYIKHNDEKCHDLDWFMMRYPLEISDEDREILQSRSKQYVEDINELEQILSPNYVPRKVSFKDGLSLRNYQGQFVDLYMKVKRILNGDDLGLGKTIEAVGTFLHDGTLPAVVVVQTHLPTQWKEKIEEFTDLRVHMISGTRPYDLPESDVYIIRYSCLAGWTPLYGRGIFNSVIFDEIQELRRAESMKYEAAEALVSDAEYVLGLSATPIYNHGEEMFNVMNIIKPRCLGDRGSFLREWTNNDKDIERPKEFGSYLRSNHLFVRRVRADVGKELPDINTIVHEVGYDLADVKDSEELAKTLALKTLQGSFVERGQAARELDILLRQNTGVSKARSVANYAKMFLESGEKVLLVGWHRDVYDIWLKELEKYNPAMYTGSESSVQKERSKKDFLEGKSQVLIMSLRSGSGLDGLQKVCSVVIFGELDWSPGVHNQVVGRLNRDGQERQVSAIYLITNYGSDPPMVDLLSLKKSQAKGINDPFESNVEAQHSDDSRLKKLAKDYLERNGIKTIQGDEKDG